MAEHDVRMNTKNFPLGRVDLDFEVRADGAMLGTLSVSSGGLSWRPASHQKKHGTEIPWAVFADWAESE